MRPLNAIDVTQTEYYLGAERLASNPQGTFYADLSVV